MLTQTYAAPDDRSMLKNLWYVVSPSSQLTNDLKAIRIVGQSFVAFRDEHGKACLLSDVCVHRGGSLSTGNKVGGSVQCPYHGWRFGAEPLVLGRSNQSRCIIKIELSTIAASMLTGSTIVPVVESGTQSPRLAFPRYQALLRERR